MTLTFKYRDRAIDVKINEKLELRSVIEILKDNAFKEMDAYSRLYSQRQQAEVSLDKNASEANIYNGDILEIS